MRLAPAIRLFALLTTVVALTACEEQTSGADRGPDPTLAPLPAGGGEIAGSRIDPLFGEAADAITEGRFAFEIRCWTEKDWEEVIDYWRAELGAPADASGFILGLSDVQLSPAVCAPLTRFAYRPDIRHETVLDLDTVEAIETFAHEIGHSVVGSNEAATECWAIQRAGRIARVLGAVPGTARSVGRLYFRELYPRMPENYRSDECRDGGALDLQPQSPVWP